MFFSQIKIQELFNIFNIVLFDKFFLQYGTEVVITCLVFTCKKQVYQGFRLYHGKNNEIIILGQFCSF